MRWWVFLAAVLVAAALDMSMGAVFVVGDLRPRLLPATVVFALLSMPRKGTVRAAMLAGLVADPTRQKSGAPTRAPAGSASSTDMSGQPTENSKATIPLA
jgi:hypothetical protein